ncbi:hypothetical protein SEUCBS139899_009859 [Sporothrix eucalyptigena]|uniref:Uncharacterized protein n=1 Tax=Sporothrix eucalyptigena TaxID=1812306 RepID=A0ABP0CZG4_9PEZI
MSSLEGKVVAVTGGASGIGFATVQKLLAAKAKVAAADVSPCPDAFKDHADVMFTVVDVSSRTQVNGWVQAVVARFGRLDAMVPNAGINHEMGIYDEDAVFQRTVAVNLTGVWNCGTEAYRQFNTQNSVGVICNTASIAGIRPSKGAPIYSAIKSGVIGLTKSWALEWAAQGVRVNALAPGPVASAGYINAIKEKPEFDLSQRVPMQRVGEPEEMASVIVFLLSSEASFVTGHVVAADGGMLLAGSSP